MRDVPRTAVVFLGGIGDTLLAGPALRRLSRDAPLTLAGMPERLRLLALGDLAAEVLSTDALAFHTLFAEPAPEARRFFARHDRVVLFLRDADAVARAVRDCGAATVEAHPGVPPDEWRAHASKYYAHCLGLPAQPPLHLAPGPYAGPPPGIVVHPGSGATSKNWPLERFVAVVRHAHDRGFPVTWLLGPAELDRGFREALPAAGRVATPGTLAECAALLAAATAFLGNDSGATHLAAAVGTPVTAVFGPTNPAVWAPRGGHVHVVAQPGWPEVAAVRHAFNACLGRQQLDTPGPVA
jgi:ADP-heptose:LPS heptosyltransferase